jgi:acylphosphatase
MKAGGRRKVGRSAEPPHKETPVTENEEIQKGFKVVGKVQGVFYRAWTRDTARELGVTGTVKNLQDGSVEIHARAEPETLERFEERLWEGSQMAKVKSVESFESGARLPDGFEVLPS